MHEQDRSELMAVQQRNALEAALGMKAASGTVTIDDEPTAGKVVVLYGVTYEFVAAGSGASASGRVAAVIGEDDDETRDNLLAAIRATDGSVRVEAGESSSISVESRSFGSDRNVTITTDDSNVTVAGMSGGEDGRAPFSRVITCGTKVVAAAATPEKLVATSSQCRGVWVGSPVTSDGAAVNTKVALLGDSNNQVIPLLIDNFSGVFLRVSDPSTVYVKVGANGESVSYCVFD